MTDEIDQVRLSFRQAIQAESGSLYHNVQQLGRGGNAVTFLMIAGSGPSQGVPFAVKIFRRVSKPERRQSFLDEVRFLQECNHPNILRIFDEGTHGGEHPFVVSEYLPQTLADVIRVRSTSLAVKVSYALQLLSTLDYLGSLSPAVIHRDIKPQNIFIKGPSCVLGDFGLMKRLDTVWEESSESVVKESVGPGMPFYYRTPDLVDYAGGGRLPTVKSDVFQLGLVLAELFTGRNPERRAENNDFLSEVVLDPIGFIPGSFHAPIRNLVASMLEMAPGSRPTAKEVLPAWRDLFFSVADAVNAIEGRVF